MQFQQRWQRLRAQLDVAGVDAALVLSAENRRYLTGFTGSNGQVWVDRDRVVLLTDGRYGSQAQAQAAFDDLVVYERMGSALGDLTAAGGRYGFEAGAVTVQAWRELREHMAGDWVEFGERLERLRAVKDEREVAAIRDAIEIAEAAYSDVADRIKPGRTERDVALELEWAVRRRGSVAIPFDVIVASGTRSALPHGIASEKRIEVGDGLTIDFGAEAEGYFSDMTFSGSVGARNSWHDDIIAVLREAQAAAVGAIAPGVGVADVDRAARDVVAAAGYGDAFIHSLGHGVGLAVHEAPRLSRHSNETLDAGMVVTVEPGIYIEDRGGARVEDMVLVTDQGAEVLTTLAKTAALWPFTNEG